MELLRVTVTVEGDMARARWTIPAEAHSLGVTCATGSRCWRLGDELGTPQGALSASIYAREALNIAAGEVARAWSTVPLF